MASKSTKMLHLAQIGTEKGVALQNVKSRL